MVTHEPDIASYARRNVVMKDGLLRSDNPVTNRLDAALEIQKVPEIDEQEIETILP
jgi:putative ABC transport system ATP-binding protein